MSRRYSRTSTPAYPVASGGVEHGEELEHVRVDGRGAGAAPDAIRQHLGADAAVLGQEGEQQVVLARGSTSRRP